MNVRSIHIVRVISATLGVVLLGFVLVLATRDGGVGTQSSSPLICELVHHIEGIGFLSLIHISEPTSPERI